MSSDDQYWPELRSDVSAVKARVRKDAEIRVVDVSLTQGELSAEVVKLAEQVESLSSDMSAQQVGAHEGQREGVEEQIVDLVRMVKSCLAEFARLDKAVNDRVGEVEDRVEHGLSVFGDIESDVIDLRSLHSEVGELHLQTVAENERLRAELRQELIRLEGGVRGRFSEVEARMEGDLEQVVSSQREIAEEVIDLRSLRSELGAAQMQSIEESGRLREELLAEAEQLRHIVEDARETAEKAMYQASAASGTNDALQADFDSAHAEAQRRLNLVDALIEQLDQRVESAGTAITERFNHAMQDTHKWLTQFEASVFERDKRRVSNASALAASLQQVEGRVEKLEGPVPADQDSEMTLPAGGWQFERRQSGFDS